MNRMGRCGRRRRANLNQSSKKKLQKVVSLAHEVEYVKLKQWMKGEGFQDKFGRNEGNVLQPCWFEDTGRGLRAKERVLPGDCVVSIPETLLITTTTVFNSSLGSAVIRRRQTFTPQQLLTLFLVVEKCYGNRSFWSPYITSLPETYSTTLYFSDEELEMLPFRARKKALRLKNRFAKACLEIKTFVKENCPTVSGTDVDHLILWAWSTVDTRSVYLETPSHPHLKHENEESNVALAPFLDLLNHSNFVEVTAGLNPVTRNYNIISHNTYDKYEQIFICYGMHDNTRLLVNYGFTLPNNMNNVVRFSLDDFRTSLPKLPHLERKTIKLREANLDKNLVCSLDGVSWSLMTAMKVLALSWDQLSSWKVLIQGAIFSEDNEEQAEKLAVRLIESALCEAKRHLETVASLPDSQHKCHLQRLAQDDVQILDYSLQSLIHR